MATGSSRRRDASASVETRGGERGLDPRHVLGVVHFPEVASARLHLDAADGDPGLEKAELLEAFPALQPALRPRGVGAERGGAVGVDADMVEDGDGFAGTEAAAGEGDHLLGEVERAEGVVEDGGGAAAHAAFLEDRAAGRVGGTTAV